MSIQKLTCKSQNHEQMMNMLEIITHPDTTPLCIMYLKNNCFGLCFRTTAALDNDKLSNSNLSRVNE